MLLIFFPSKNIFLQQWGISVYTIVWDYTVTIFSSY